MKEFFKIAEWHHDLDSVVAAAVSWKEEAESQCAMLLDMPLKQLKEQGSLMGIDIKTRKSKAALMAAILPSIVTPQSPPVCPGVSAAGTVDVVGKDITAKFVDDAGPVAVVAAVDTSKDTGCFLIG